MGWWPFRRGAAGRHALGAAVTSIPSGPLVLPVEVAPPAPAVERLAELLDALGGGSSAPVGALEAGQPHVLAFGEPAGPAVAPAAQPVDLALVADAERRRSASSDVDPQVEVDGLAWLSEALAWNDAPEQVEPSASVAQALHELPVVVPAAVDLAPVVAAPASAEVPPVVAPLAVELASSGAAPTPDAPPLVVVPHQSPPPFVPTGPPLLDPALLAVGSVQLGFRDGTTASLEPEQARALQDLARSLTSSGHAAAS